MKRLALGLVLSLAFSSSASALSFGFDCIAGAAVPCGVGEAALSVDVTAGAGGEVLLTFSNSGPSAASVTGIYIDQGGLIDRVSLVGGTGTDFRRGGRPSNLLGGGAISFHDDFRFTAKRPKAPNGVNGGESLTIALTLRSGKTYADVISALAGGSLRLGLVLSAADPACVGDDVEETNHKCTGDPGVAAFVNRPNPVPEPMPALLGGVACLGLALIGRRRH